MIVGASCTLGTAATFTPFPCIAACSLVAANHSGMTEYAFREASGETGRLFNRIPRVESRYSEKAAGLMLGVGSLTVGYATTFIITDRIASSKKTLYRSVASHFFSLFHFL